MTVTHYIFDTRKNEIDLFLENLCNIEESNEYSMDFLNILHSNVLLMLYNLVEATVVGGIIEIYDAVKDSGYNYRQVSAKIKGIWFEYKFKQAYDPNAHHNSYKKKASQIIDEILKDKVIELDRKAINAEGNLTAQIIRNICNDHGIRFTAPPESKGGIRIDEVTDIRNSLAHGGKSFIECGRNFTLNDLRNVTNEIKNFLKSLLDGMTVFYNNQQWQCS